MEHIQHFINLIHYLFLGLFQGFTEPIPISSSGHLVLLRELFQIEIPGLSFEILVHFGSLLAIVFVFREEIFTLIKSCYRFLIKRDQEAKLDFHFVILLVIATLPAGILVLLFEEKINQLLQFTFLVGCSLLVTGIFLWIIRKKVGKKGDNDLSIRHAFIIGLAQALALFPGISRSGATIVAAMLLGLKKELALRFSFLLYIPVSLGASMISAKNLVSDFQISLAWIPSIIALLAAI